MREEQSKKPEKDIMLVLNKTLLKAEKPEFFRFSKMRYSPSGAISALLTKKANAIELFKTRTNILIQAAKTINQAVINVLERWHWLKIHRILLDKYLGKRKIELFKQKVESSIRI